MKEYTYYTYKITLLKGDYKGCYYLGQHKQDKSKIDDYAGSGTALKEYYASFGKEEGVTYKKKILKYYKSEKELDEAEIKLISDKYKTDKKCLNRIAGGKSAYKGTYKYDVAYNKILDEFPSLGDVLKECVWKMMPNVVKRIAINEGLYSDPDFH